MARLRPAVVAVIGTALLLAGCGTAEPEAPAAGSTPPRAPTTAATSARPADDAPVQTPEKPPPAVPEQLKFTAKTVDGTKFSGASLAGRPALLWFWAPWCPNCQAEAPDIAEAAKTSTNVQFVGVAAQDQVPAMQDFVRRFGLDSFPHLADTDAAVWKRFGVTYQPAYAFISSGGDVDVETTILDRDELLDRLSALT